MPVHRAIPSSIVLALVALCALVGGLLAFRALRATHNVDAATQVDFSIRIGSGAGSCDSSGTPTSACTIALGSTFDVDVYLRSIPSGLPGGGYSGYDASVGYSGVTLAGSWHTQHFPGCVYDAYFSGPGQVAAGCSLDTGAAPSAYLGVLVTFHFVCNSSGTVTLLAGAGNTDIVDSNLFFYAESVNEALSISCQVMTPTPTATSTPTRTPTHTPTEAGTPSPTPAPQAYPGDTDADGCPDERELQIAAGSQMSGGRRDYLNPWDYFNPTGDHQNRIDDVLAVIQRYGKDAGDPGYATAYDRSSIGPNLWNLGPPNGQIRIDDVLHVLHQYGHDCS